MKKLEAFLKRKNFSYENWHDSIAIPTDSFERREQYILKKFFNLCFNNKIEVKIARNFITMKEVLPVKQDKK